MRALTDIDSITGAALEGGIQEVAEERLRIADACLSAAKLLVDAAEFRVQRQAIPRAYYAAYHAVRAVILAVERRDVNEHDALASLVARVVSAPTGNELKDLRNLRNEFEYAAYPGPDAASLYTEDEQLERVRDVINRSGAMVAELKRFLEGRV